MPDRVDNLVAIEQAVQVFGAESTTKLAAGLGEPEDQIRAPLEMLLYAIGQKHWPERISDAWRLTNRRPYSTPNGSAVQRLKSCVSPSTASRASWSACRRLFTFECAAHAGGSPPDGVLCLGAGLDDRGDG